MRIICPQSTMCLLLIYFSIVILVSRFHHHAGNQDLLFCQRFSRLSETDRLKQQSVAMKAVLEVFPDAVSFAWFYEFGAVRRRYNVCSGE